MDDTHQPDSREQQKVFRAIIASKETRKLRARGEQSRSLWFGLGMFGVVGWSIALPTVLGVAMGLWIDRRWPSRFSWTLMLLCIGVILGCLNAWYWIKQESQQD
jgi:ATP synthase protein I